MENYKFSLLYTTARYHLIPAVIARWYSSTHNSKFQMIVVTDNHYLDSIDYKNVQFFTNEGNQNCVTGWNLCALKSTGDILIQISDDLFPPDNWDYAISNTINLNGGLTKKITLNLLDERMCRDAIYHPVLTRSSYTEIGYLYPSDFESMFCDNWFYLYHKKNSNLIESTNVFWSHRHRTTDQSVLIDDVTLRHESTQRYEKGKKTLMKYIALHELNNLKLVNNCNTF